MMDDTPPVPDQQEVAPARDSDEFIGLWAQGIRETNDPILKGRGGDLKFYDHVRSDGQVWSTLQQRFAAVAARSWEVQPGAEDTASEEAAKRLQEELTACDFEAKMGRMHWGIFYGYSVAEIMWGSDNGRISFGEIKVRRARRFGFNIDGQLMLRAHMSASEQIMPDAKFWVMTTNSDTDDEPYGLGLGHLLYWPAYFKRAGIKSWMIALDKYASPTAKGSFPPGTSKEDQARLLAGLRAIKQDSALIHPDGVVVEYLQSAKSASADYREFDKRMDGWISKVVLSQTMTTDDGSSKSQSSTHMEVRDEVAESDADMITSSFNNGPAEWWTRWNFGDRATTPVVRRMMETEEDQDTAADRDTKLYAMGWEPTDERISDTYGEGYRRRAAVPPVGGTPGQTAEDAPALAEADGPDAVGVFVDELVSSGAAPEAVADILAPIVDAMDGATSLSEIGERLDALSLSDDALEPFREHLAQAMFAARLGGEVGASLREGVEVETV